MSVSIETLRAALSEGDPQRVQALIEAGADIRYRAEHGYGALIDAVHGRDVARDPRLLDLLALLVAHGAELSGISAYQESGLRVLSRIGRFDAVRLLLQAGADPGHLGWTPLLEATALGSLADMEAALAQGAPLEERDWWDRSAFLLAVLKGDVSKAKLLRDRGANVAARGRCGCPPLFYAIRGHHPHMLRWLLHEGADVEQADAFGRTALMEAAELDDLECVEVLITAGADVLHASATGTALDRAESRPVILRLIEAGADPADADQQAILRLCATADEALATVTPDEFRRNATRRFGTQNPERMNNPFWEAMVRCGATAYEASSRFATVGRQSEETHQPVWCASRFGQTLTLLPDGRAVQIGGEHEDFYDPDFCIYNDVFVHEVDGSVAIYGYPESVFPPTDFHTATLVGDTIYVIGALGYGGHRSPGLTPVYQLDLDTFRIAPVQARGEAPGWIYRHRAALVGPRAIRVWGGTVVKSAGGTEWQAPNQAAFVLDLDHLRWRQE